MFDLSEHWIVKPKPSETELTRKAHQRQPSQCKKDFGGSVAQFVDSEGAHCSVGAEAAQRLVHIC